MREQTINLILPTRWGAYFVNGDVSGFDAEQRREVEACRAWIRYGLCGGADFWCVDCGDEEGFRWSNDWNEVGDITARFTFRFVRPSDTWRNVWSEFRRNGRGGDVVQWRREWWSVARACLSARETWSTEIPLAHRLDSWKARKHNSEATI